ncbi:MAG: hypothetical protein LBS65_05405 [Desulfovibrio sp.]|nr:hypothetical protein [Desulfovibrio sp.]
MSMLNHALPAGDAQCVPMSSRGDKQGAADQDARTDTPPFRAGSGYPA